jgi:YHS domain-containing protein
MRGLPLLFYLLAVAVVVWPFLRRGRRAPEGPRRDELVKDPVCQTYVVRSRAISRTAGGEARYFCSDDCARRYAALGG